MTRVRPGIEVLVGERRRLIAGRRVGVLTHPAAVTSNLCSTVDALRGTGGAEVVRIFAPEHGVGGALQDMVPSRELRDPVSGLPVVSLYGEDEASLTPRGQDLDGLDLVVVDLVDVGSRYYTFAATAIRFLSAAADAGLPVVVADRPNPLNGTTIEGCSVEPGLRSFVSELPVPQRHGLTLGELCLFARELRGIDLELEVVPAKGWTREIFGDGTGLPWVMPSPNMPTLDTALVYPGACLIEGTNVSEGRGTTRPFELVGAPFLEGRRLAADLAGRGLRGIVFRPVVFTPAFHKYAGEVCGGVQWHVTDRAAFRPLRAGLELIAACLRQAREDFRWRTETYEFIDEHPAIDLLAGTSSWRKALEEGIEAEEIAAGWPVEEQRFAEARRPCLLYVVA